MLRHLLGRAAGPVQQLGRQRMHGGPLLQRDALRHRSLHESVDIAGVLGAGRQAERRQIRQGMVPSGGIHLAQIAQQLRARLVPEHGHGVGNPPDVLRLRVQAQQQPLLQGGGPERGGGLRVVRDGPEVPAHRIRQQAVEEQGLPPVAWWQAAANASSGASP